MSNEFTVKEFAAIERVADRTVRRWIEKGAIEVRRTPGGGVRILREVPIITIHERKASQDRTD